MSYTAIIIVLLVLVIVYFISRGRLTRNSKDHRANNTNSSGNVISMDKHRKTKTISGDQPCSSCKKKNGKLIFYAQENGTIVGLCKNCKSKAIKQDMLPL